MASKKTYGDAAKISQDEFSFRAKRGVLRGDEKSTYDAPKKAKPKSK